jgi:tetratricopeptide (TPR) repeat protein/transposase
MLQVVRRYGDKKVDPLVDKIRDEINDFTQGMPQSDDITLVAIKEKLKAEDVLFNLRNRLMGLVKEEKMTVKEACRVVGVSTSTYYKYKKRYEKLGVEGLKEKVGRSDIEERHISIEDQAKIIDIIKNHPEYGAKRISEELKTEKYGEVELDDRRIYEELVRSHLNTRELREVFLSRGDRGKRLKPPGTPFLTLDGQIVITAKERHAGIDRELEEMEAEVPVSGEKPMELRVSQKSVEEVMVEPAEQEGDTVLDEFLGLSPPLKEPGEAGGDGGGPEDGDFPDVLPPFLEGEESEEEKETLEEESILENEADEDVLATMDDWVVEKLTQEPFAEEAAEESGEQELHEKLGELTEETPVESLEELEDQVLLDEEFTDILESFDEVPQPEETEERIDLKKILEVEEDRMEAEQAGEAIEDSISASIAGELFDEELGLDENRDRGIHKEEGVQEEDFLEMMEDLGFDRRTVLSEKGVVAERTGKQSPSDLNKKRFLDAGQWFYRQGHYNKAVNEFQKAIREDSDFAAAYHFLGDALFRMGKLDRAREAYERVRQLEPDNVDVLENLGVIFANRGDYKKALWQWGEVLKRSPERKDIIQRIKKMQRVIRQRYL